MTSYRHTYVIVRHGFSKANESKTIVSSPHNGMRPEFGLTDRGREQCRTSAAALRDHLKQAHGDADIVLLTSPFSRAAETAALFLEGLRQDADVAARIVTPRPDVSFHLCERHFGELELGPDTLYPSVWAEDATSAFANTRQVEPVASVWGRVSSLVSALEAKAARRCVVLLFSHGDTLQITQTGFAGLPLTTHRSLKHLVQAEWRVLGTATTTTASKL